MHFPGMGTICNMGAEIGATTSVFPFGPSMARFLHASNRSAISDLAAKYQHILSPDENAPYDELIEINLSEVRLPTLILFLLSNRIKNLKNSKTSCNLF